MTTMFAKQAQIAVAALAFAVAGSAFAATTADTKTADRNVFDSEAALALPAARSETGLTREQVRSEFLAARASGDVSVFDYETVAYRPAADRAQQTRLARAGK
jgi:hypothetical protein